MEEESMDDEDWLFAKRPSAICAYLCSMIAILVVHRCPEAWWTLMLALGALAVLYIVAVIVQVRSWSDGD